MSVSGLAYAGSLTPIFLEENNVYNRDTYVHCGRNCEDCGKCSKDECQYDADIQQKPAWIQL